MFLKLAARRSRSSAWTRNRQGLCASSSVSFSTYYDSQSGLHLPIHKEDEITLIVDKSSNSATTASQNDPFVPPQLYKEPWSDMPDKLQALVQRGVHGIRLPPATFPRDVRNLKTLSAIAPSRQYMVFVPVADSQPIPSLPAVSPVYDYQDLVNSWEDGDTEVVVSSGSSMTTISFGREECANSEPISVANQVATLIDKQKLGDYLWLAPTTVDADDVIRLYEELIYLDVAGPTIKSRLIIQTSDAELVQEAMMSGINKFVIISEDDEDESGIQMVEEIAEELGKQILRVD
jgi:hypothetical protein